MRFIQIENLSYVQDLRRIRNEIPEIEHVALGTIEAWWKNYSYEKYFAEFIDVNDGKIAEFRRYLRDIAKKKIEL